jgi:NADPH:quinone reductase-like Zn-dependent oxidoreductase
VATTSEQRKQTAEEENQVPASSTGEAQTGSIHLILDMAGNRPLSDLRRALTPRGTLVPVGGEGGGRWIGALGRSLGALATSPFVSQRVRVVIGSAKAADRQLLSELVEAAKGTPVLERTYPHAEIPDAIRYLEGGRARGTIVITV